MGKYYIIGGGVAGLSAAVKLKHQGKNVHLFEASKYLGGRCRSYYDPHLKMILDNGNHLILGCNNAVFSYLKEISSHLKKVKIPIKVFDYQTKKKLKMPFFELIKWLFFKSKKSSDFLNHLWVSIQNTDPKLGCKIQFQSCLRAIFLKFNWTAYQPQINLTESLIKPAEKFLDNACFSTLNPLLNIQTFKNKITQLHFKQKTIEVKSDDQVIFALPITVLNKLFNLSLNLQTLYNPITNIHFKIKHTLDYPQILGLVNANAHWIFVKKDHISITISNQMIKASEKEKLISKIWKEVCFLFPNLSETIPTCKVIVEKYATLNQTPQNLYTVEKLKLPFFSNVSYVGDWTYPKFPNTIEAAIKSACETLYKEL